MYQSCRVASTYSPSAVLMEDEFSEIRVDKVLEIRRQLGEGTYSIEDRLDTVIERIMADIR